MTTCPQTLRAQRPTLAGTPATPMDDLVRTTLEACEHAHDACLHAVREALRSQRNAPPLNEWLAGASLCRTLAEVLAVEAPEAECPSGMLPAAAGRQTLSPWTMGMAQLCAGLCGELAARHAAEVQDDPTARQVHQACEGCVQACVRLLADAGPPGGGRTEALHQDADLGFCTPQPLPFLSRRPHPAVVQSPQGPNLAAA